MEDILTRIRAIRSSKDISLKTSPYLRSSFTNEFGEEKPVQLRDYQIRGIMNLLQVERMILGDDTGLGKAQPVDSLVLTPSGWSRIGDLKVGDSVIGSNGHTTDVIGVFPQGKKQSFRVTMDDGSSTECCEDHLWTVRTGNTKRSGDGWRVRSLKQIGEAGILRQRNSTGLRWEIPVVEPVHFAHTELPVDPYLLGVFIGDGSMVGGLNVTNGDPEMFQIIHQFLPKDNIYGRVSDDGITRNIIGTEPGCNNLIRALSEIGLKGCNWHTKFIPEIYLMSSVEQRSELLRGLMDTDGYVSKDGKATQFYSSNGTLVRGFVRLIQSLGGVAYVSSKIPTLRGKSRAKKGRPAFIVTISLPNWLIPFKLSRKINRWKPRTKYFPTRRISSIHPSRDIECVCIRVASPDSLYVTDDFIVTHNTLEILSTIGYVWVKEPDYVPIVLTRKSALYQWANETHRFMDGMEAVTIDGDPHERHIQYENFLKTAAGSKKLMIMTYDMLLKDGKEAVIRDRENKPNSEVTKNLKKTRKELKELNDVHLSKKEEFLSRFAKANYDIQTYLKDRLAGPVERPAPSQLSKDDLKLVDDVIEVRDRIRNLEGKILVMNDLAAPPKKVPGLIKMVEEAKEINPNIKFMLVMDEQHVLKNHRGKIHETVQELSSMCDRVYGMTATAVKNRLMEFFSLFRIVKPGLIPTIKKFQEDYCVVKIQKVGGGRRVPIVVGYRNLDKFVDLIEPYYLSRRKHEVASELPQLVTRELECELSEVQQELYDMAEVGLLESESDADDAGQGMLKAMTLVQQAVNAPQLIANEEGIPFEGPSCKIQAILDLLQDELEDAKIIIFSKFEKMISLIEKTLDEKKIKTVRITGKESDAKVREAAKRKFQDLNSGINVILITTAGSESINLQAAEHIVFVDSPWSWGDYVQITGRSIRIGSVHTMVVAHHLIAKKRDGGKTIDDHVIQTLKIKKKLADKVAGESLKGGLKFIQGTEVKDIFSLIRQGISEKKPTLLQEANRRIASATSKKTKTKKLEEPKESEPLMDIVALDLSDI